MTPPPRGPRGPKPDLPLQFRCNQRTHCVRRRGLWGETLHGGGRVWQTSPFCQSLVLGWVETSMGGGGQAQTNVMTCISSGRRKASVPTWWQPCTITSKPLAGPCGTAYACGPAAPGPARTTLYGRDVREETEKQTVWGEQRNGGGGEGRAHVQNDYFDLVTQYGC